VLAPSAQIQTPTLPAVAAQVLPGASTSDLVGNRPLLSVSRPGYQED